MLYTNIPKPTTSNYTTITKPNVPFTIRGGMITGLMIPLTYAVTLSFGMPYTKITKPPANTYTKITKPT